MNEINQFIEFISFEKRYALHTISAYKIDLEQFKKFLDAQFSISKPDDINASMVRSWLMELMEAGVKPRSVNRKITTLKSFFKFLIKSELATKNPMYKVTSPKTPKRLPVFIEGGKMDLLLDNHVFEENFEDQRNRLIIELFYATGMRLSELMNLKISDINFYEQQIRVLGKRNKERIIPLIPAVSNLIKHYLDYRKRIDNANDYLFVLENGAMMYRVLIYRIVRKHLGTVSTNEKKSPHVLRHSFATAMLNRGADLNAIKEILGHANLAATQIYTHNTIEKLKDAYNLAHPRA